MADHIQLGDVVKPNCRLMLADMLVEKDAPTTVEALPHVSGGQEADLGTGVYLGTCYVKSWSRRLRSGAQVQKLLQCFFFKGMVVHIEPKHVDIVSHVDDVCDA